MPEVLEKWSDSGPVDPELRGHINIKKARLDYAAWKGEDLNEQ